MVRMKRFLIDLLMFILFLIGADIALVKAVDGGPGPSPAYQATVLPMANLLLLFLPKLVWGRTSRRFWLGFEVVGWTVIALFAYLDIYERRLFLAPFISIMSSGLFPINSAPMIALGVTSSALLYTSPQLLVASLGAG